MHIVGILARKDGQDRELRWTSVQRGNNFDKLAGVLEKRGVIFFKSDEYSMDFAGTCTARSAGRRRGACATR